MLPRFAGRAVLAATLALAVAAAGPPGPARAQGIRNLDLRAHRNDYAPPSGQTGYSSCWSYVHADGREYAVIGTNGGTAIYNVTDPSSTYPVGFISGPSSAWREMKSYRNWIYIVTEGAGFGRGLQIVRMTNPEAPVLAATYTTNVVRSHTVSVDTARAVLILNGTRDDNGVPSGMRLLSLASPEAPVEIGRWPVVGAGVSVPDSQYVHDCVPIGNRLFASSIYSGIHRVFDLTDPASPVPLRQWSYPGGFTHNSWPDATGNWVYVTDELYGQPLKVFDISDLDVPVLKNAITSNPRAIVHNAHVLGSELYLANYTEGIRVLDATDPMHPAEFASHDTYTGVSGDYSGVWGVCPYFPSGTVIASDRNSGLYVYRVERDYGRVRVVAMFDEETLAPGVNVYLDSTDSLVTAADGAVVFAPDPGGHMVTVRAFGYEDALVGVNAVSGDEDTVVVTLVPKAQVPFAGTLRDASTQSPLEEGEVILSYTPLHEHTDGSGAWDFGTVPVGDYAVEVRAPGHAPAFVTREIGPGPTIDQDYQLRPAARWEDLETATGWSVGAIGDDAVQGTWVRVDPLGTGDEPPGMTNSANGPYRRPGPGLFHEGHGAEGDMLPGSVQPDADRTPGAGTLCFVTGQGTDPYWTSEADIDGGRTTALSPALSIVGMTDPRIGVWRWFYTNTPYDLNDFLMISISGDGGTNWTVARTIGGMQNHWVEETIRVFDHLAPGPSSVRMRFVAADLGVSSVVEAAFDDLTVYDAALPAVEAPAGARPAAFALRSPRPNPSRGDVSFVVELPRAGALRVDVLDVTGRRVAVLHDGEAAAGLRAFSWDGRRASGAEAGAGLFLVRVLFEGEALVGRVARVR